MARKYDLLFVDIDGTLSGEADHISQANLDALAAASAAGCEVVVCTGRSRFTAARAIEQIGGAYAIVLNGAVVYCLRSGAAVRRITLDAASTRIAATTLASAGLAPLAFGVEDDDRPVYTAAGAPIHPRYIAINRDRLRVVEQLPGMLPRLPIMVAAYDVQARVDPAADELASRLGPDAMVIRSWAPVYGCWCVEAHSVQSGKHAAARAVAERLGIPRERTMAIGDNHNDTQLIRWAGLGVAMGDGPFDVREAADHVTGALDDDGAAQAIHRFLLDA